MNRLQNGKRYAVWETEINDVLLTGNIFIGKFQRTIKTIFIIIPKILIIQNRILKYANDAINFFQTRWATTLTARFI